ncbi:MAG: hypothetical protein ACRDL5_00965 [Solirubrobacteraceae bacterium]
MDRAECSWAPLGGPPAWRSCGAGPRTYPASPLPHRHRLYLVQVRGTDDFGRSTVASAQYDAVPCTLSIWRPAGIARLLGAGIPVSMSCSAVLHAEIVLKAFAVNGRRSGSPRGAVAENPALGELVARTRETSFTIHRRLQVSPAARRALRHASSVALVVAAGDDLDLDDDIADSLSYRVLTVRR